MAGPMQLFMTLLAILVTLNASLASTETYQVIPSHIATCKKDGYCMTLSQLAAKPSTYFSSNTTFILEPRHHTLDLDLHFTNITFVHLWDAV